MRSVSVALTLVLVASACSDRPDDPEDASMDGGTDAGDARPHDARSDVDSGDDDEDASEEDADVDAPVDVGVDGDDDDDDDDDDEDGGHPIDGSPGAPDCYTMGDAADYCTPIEGERDVDYVACLAEFDFDGFTFGGTRAAAAAMLSCCESEGDIFSYCEDVIEPPDGVSAGYLDLPDTLTDLYIFQYFQVRGLEADATLTEMQVRDLYTAILRATGYEDGCYEYPTSSEASFERLTVDAFTSFLSTESRTWEERLRGDEVNQVQNFLNEHGLENIEVYSDDMLSRECGEDWTVYGDGRLFMIWDRVLSRVLFGVFHRSYEPEI